MKCALSYCDKPVKCRGLCNAHCSQQYRGEELRPLRQPKTGCNFKGCQRPHQAKGWCSRHYQQILEGKQPTKILPYRDESVSYEALHTRIKRARGRAAQYNCVECDGPADDWAYTYGCPRETQSPRGPYTTDISRYQPMCRSCHRSFDNSVGRVPT